MPRLKTRKRRRYIDLGARPQEFWSRQYVINCITAFHRSGFVPNVKWLTDNNYNPRVLDILQKVVGVRTTSNGLVAACRKHIGFWDEALKLAKLDRREIRADILWRREHIIGGIQMLKRNHIPLASVSLTLDKSRKTKSLLEKHLGFKTTARKFCRAGFSIFGSWSSALQAAGLDPAEVTLRYWTEQKTLRSIRMLHKHDVPLNVYALANNRSQKMNSILYETTGHRTTGKNLYWAGKKNFGSWDNALRAAGIDPATVRRRPGYWTKELVIQVIRAFQKAEIPLNSASLYADSYPLSRNILKKMTGRKVDPHSLYLAGGYWFGSWEKALRAAGVEPTKVGNRRLSSLPVIPHQKEWTQCADGRWRNIAYYGAPPEQADDAIERNELNRKVASAFESLDATDHGDALEIYDFILSIKKIKEVHNLPRLIAKRTKGRISETRAKVVLGRLAVALKKEKAQSAIRTLRG